MLSRMEKEMMRAVYALSHEKGSCLVSAKELTSRLSEEVNCEDMLSALKSDEYLDYLSSMRKGEEVFVITLLARGQNFPREMRKERETYLIRLIMAVGGAIVSFLVGLILKSLWK